MIDDGYDGVGGTLLTLAAAAPPFAMDRLREARRLDRRRTRLARGVGGCAVIAVVIAAALTVAGTGSVSHTGHDTLGPAALATTRLAPAAPADDRPSYPPPAIASVDLGARGNDHAITGDGWALYAQTNTTHAVRLGVNGRYGQSTGDVTAYPPTREMPLTGLSGDGIATVDESRGTISVAFGGVPRGTTGVAVFDSAGHRGWAKLIDPGAAFDRLLYAYEPPHGATIVSLASYAGGHRTSRRDFTPTRLAGPDPGQQAATGVVRIERPVDAANPHDRDFCLVIIATRQRSCDVDTVSTAGLVELMRLPDGRLAVGGRISQSENSVVIDAPSGRHHLMLGLLVGAPEQFLWVGAAPEPASGRQPTDVGTPSASTCSYDVTPDPVFISIGSPEASSYAIRGPKVTGVLTPGGSGRPACGPAIAATPTP